MGNDMVLTYDMVLANLVISQDLTPQRYDFIRVLVLVPP